MSPDSTNGQANTVEDLLYTGIAAAKSGQRERARDLLTRVVEQDEENIPAWLWLSGVVDSLDEQEICLENVLTLDPNHEAARKGLAWVQQQKKTQAPPPADRTSPPAPSPEPPKEIQMPTFLADTMPSSPSKTSSAEMTHTERLFSPVATVLGDEFIRRHTPPDSPLSPSAVQDEFDDEYLCPYCATQTHPDDRKCKACGGELWVKIPRREKPSVWFWVVLALQAISTIRHGIGLVAALVLAVGQAGAGDPSPLLSTYEDIPPEVAGIVLPLILLISTLIFGYHLVVLVGLYLRWMAIFYLYLIGALLTLVLAAMAGIFLGASGGAGLVCGGGGVILAILMVLMIFVLKEDFTFDKQRILLRIDRGVTSALDLLHRGRHYAERNMWAMAALHLRRAARIMPDQMDPHLMLTAIYINLKRYDLADQALARARRISPSDPQVEKLTALLDRRRAAIS